MALFTLANWPLLFVSAAMVVAAVIDGWKLKVPNWLTLPLIVSGWALGLLHNCGLLEGTGEGGVGAALAGTALGFVLLLPVYVIGGMQMGFGSWVGAFFGLWSGLGVIWWAFAVAVLIGGALALGMIAVRGQYRRNLANTREIVGDWLGAKGVGDVADKAAKRKPRLHLLPYGIPLCLGFVGYLVYLHGF
jgi:prepilin peptidase CpaA